jgi:phospholipase/carboxylesterase
VSANPGFAPPVVAMAGSADPAAPLVVLLHGRGSHEREMLALADRLPAGPAYAAVRAPIAEGGGYAWFANRGIGRPLAESLRATMDWFGAWLGDIAPPGRPVVLIGFSGGAAFAGGLLLDDPRRYAGAAILYGTLPFDAGLATPPARLVGVPLVVAQGERDTVIPRELLDRTWDYLLGPSGAPTTARRDPVGHTIAAPVLTTLARWLRERLAFLTHRGRPAPGPTTWTALPHRRLPTRAGARPEVSSTIPQEQRTDNAPAELQEQLFARVAALPGVTTRQSAISVPGARGLMLDPPRLGPDDAFLVPAVGEFAHLHPGYDGSLHITLPPLLAADVIAKGWGVAHPLAGVRLTPGMVLLFGPRDATELETVVGVVATSHAWAAGEPTRDAD